jgi:hypothetical protein
MLDKNKDKLEEIILLHNSFCQALKLVEQLKGEIDFASVNDIRYALRACLDCIQAILHGDQNKFDTSYDLTLNALNIGWHDLVDISVAEYKLYMEALNSKYGPSLVAKHLPNKEHAMIIFEIEDQVRGSRTNRFDRSEIYKNITDNHLEKLLKLYRIAVTSESTIEAEFIEIEAKSQKTVQDTGRQRIIVIATVLIALVAVAGVGAPYLMDDKAPGKPEICKENKEASATDNNNLNIECKAPK